MSSTIEKEGERGVPGKIDNLRTSQSLVRRRQKTGGREGHLTRGDHTARHRLLGWRERVKLLSHRTKHNRQGKLTSCRRCEDIQRICMMYSWCSNRECHRGRSLGPNLDLRLKALCWCD